MAGYGAKSSDINEKSYLGYGEHSGVHITDISAGVKKRQKSEETDDVCDVTFTGLQGQFQLRMFNPDVDTDEERKAKNQEYISKLMSYILKKLKNKDIDVPAVGSWKELTDWFISQAGQKADYNKVSLELKLVGNVYNDKANVQVTRYFGWLERTDSGKKVKFSANEIASNNAYDAKMKTKQPKTEGGEATEEGKTEDLVF